MYVSSDSEEEAPPQHEDKSTLEAKMAVATVGAIPPPSGLPTGTLCSHCIIRM